MRKKVLFGLLAVCLVVSLATPGVNPSHAAKKFVSIASGWVVGVYYPLAGAISSIAHKNLPDIKITVESSGASVANAELDRLGRRRHGHPAERHLLLRRAGGQADVRQARGEHPRHHLALQEHCQIQARKAAKIATVKDLKGKKVCVGPLAAARSRTPCRSSRCMA